MLRTTIAQGFMALAVQDAHMTYNESCGDDGLPAHVDVEDLDPNFAAEVQTICDEFEQRAKHLLPETRKHYASYEAIGNDFWFTMLGHGVGFWDRDLPGDLGDQLTTLSGNGECHLFVDDNGKLNGDIWNKV